MMIYPEKLNSCTRTEGQHQQVCMGKLCMRALLSREAAVKVL